MRYRDNGFIRKGGQAYVRKAYDVVTGRNVALKIYKKSKMNQKEKDAVHFERQMLQQIEHRNIIKYSDFFEDDKHMLFVMDYMVSDLRDLLLGINMPFEEQATKEIFYQMVQAVNHLHSHNIIHRDIKLENFLVGENLETIKIIDFGLTTIYEPENPPSLICGTLISAAPEMHSSPSYDSKIDCWALGIVLFEMLSNDLPFNTESLDEYRQNILYSDIEFSQHLPLKVVSEDALDMLSRLLEKQPGKRMSAAEALNHPWFDSLRKC